MDQERIYTDEPIPSSVPPRQKGTEGSVVRRPADFPFFVRRELYENLQMPGTPPRIAALKKMFDPEAKKLRHETVFPQECRKAFEMGAALATKEL